MVLLTAQLSKTYLPMHSVPVQLQVSGAMTTAFSICIFYAAVFFAFSQLCFLPWPHPHSYILPFPLFLFFSLFPTPVLSELQFILAHINRETPWDFFFPRSVERIYSKPVLWLDLDTLIHSRAIIVGGMTAPLIWFLSQDWVLIKDLLSFIFIYLLS